MGKTSTREAVPHILRKIQEGQTDMRNMPVDVRRDIRTMKDEIVSLRTIMGEFMTTDARREGDYHDLINRVERIKQHLHLREH